MSLLVDVVAGWGRAKEGVYRLISEGRKKNEYGYQSKKKAVV